MSRARILADYVATGVTAAEFDQLDTTSGTPGSGNFLRGDKTWQAISATTEGTAVLSTGESGGTKFLREDGDNSSSWQQVTLEGEGHVKSTGEAAGQFLHADGDNTSSWKPFTDAFPTVTTDGAAWNIGDLRIQVLTATTGGNNSASHLGNWSSVTMAKAGFSTVYGAFCTLQKSDADVRVAGGESITSTSTVTFYITGTGNMGNETCYIVVIGEAS